MTPCVIFDLDGTLVDSLSGIAASLNCTLTAHGLPGHSNANVRSFVGDGLQMLIRRAVYPGADPALIESLVTLFKKDYDLSWAEGTKAYPGIHDLLHELQSDGFQMAVLSNKTHEFTGTITRKVFPKIHFAQVLGQQDGIPHKPHPEGALRIAAAMGEAPDHCIVIGDSTMDLETAANADMQAIAVAWGYHDRDRLLTAGASRIAEDPEELLKMLREEFTGSNSD